MAATRTRSRLQEINEYIQGASPAAGPQLLKLLGTTEFNVIETARNYKKIARPKLGAKLGSGRFGTVYALENTPGVIVKIVKHAVYKDGSRSTGREEASIINHLNETVDTLGIIRLYQYTPGTGNDYLYLERMKCSLWDWLGARQQPVAAVKSVILQVLTTLAKIQAVYPEFRHNDLKINNILIGGNIGSQAARAPRAKIADFDYSCLRPIAYRANASLDIKNEKINSAFTAKFGCSSRPNNIYDGHLFLNSLWQSRKLLPRTVITWIEQQLPVETRGDETVACKFGRLREPDVWKDKIKTPRELAGDSFLRPPPAKKA